MRTMANTKRNEELHLEEDNFRTVVYILFFCKIIFKEKNKAYNHRIALRGKLQSQRSKVLSFYCIKKVRKAKIKNVYSTKTQL